MGAQAIDSRARARKSRQASRADHVLSAAGWPMTASVDEGAPGGLAAGAATRQNVLAGYSADGPNAANPGPLRGQMSRQLEAPR